MKITKESVHAALDQPMADVSLSQWERQRMVYVAVAAGRSRKRSHPVLRRLLATASILSVCLAFSMVVLASPDLSFQLSNLSRQALTFLSPAVGSCEQDGIRMEVLAAMNDGEDMVAYIALKDTTGQNRLDESMNLCDLRIDNNPGGVMYSYPTRREDGSYVVRVQGEAEDLYGGKAAVGVHTILSGRSETDYLDTGYTVQDFLRENETPALVGMLDSYNAVLYRYDGTLEKAMTNESLMGLKAVGEYVDPRAPFMTFQNAGVVNDALHILADPDNEAWYNLVEFALFDENGVQVEADIARLSVGSRLKDVKMYSEYGTEQVEYVLALPQDMDPANLHLYYAVESYDHCLENAWEITFAVEKSYVGVSAACDVDMKPWHLTGVEVSPIGLTVHGSGTRLEDSLSPQIQLILTDGTTKRDFNGSVSSVSFDPEGGPDKIMIKSYFDEPLDVNLIQTILVNGTEIWHKQ